MTLSVRVSFAFDNQGGNDVRDRITNIGYDADVADLAIVMFASNTNQTRTESGVGLAQVRFIHRTFSTPTNLEETGRGRHYERNRGPLF